MIELFNEIYKLANPEVYTQVSHQNKLNNARWYEENEKFIASITGKKTTNIKVSHDKNGRLIKIIGNKIVTNPVTEY